MLFLSFVPKYPNFYHLQILANVLRAFKFSLIVVLAIFATSCSGKRGAISNVSTTLLAQDQARIILKRFPANKSDTDSLYSRLSARISFNGKKVGEMSPGDSFSTDVNHGRIRITIDNEIMPGQYSISLNAKPKTEYKFDISARAASNSSGKFFGIFDLKSYESSNENSGLFKIVEVSSKKLATTPSLPPVKAAPKQKPIIQSKPLLEPVKVAPKQKPIIQSKQILAPVKVAPKQKTIIQLKPSSAPVKPFVSRSKKRLLELKTLLDEELISRKDYDLKKRQILRGL